SDTNVNWRTEKSRAGLGPRISWAQVVLIHSGQVKSGDATTVSGKDRRDGASAFRASGETGTGHRPLLRTDKAVMKRVDRGEGHGQAPCRRVIPRMLRAVPRQ